MTPISIGDLAQALQFRRQSADITSKLSRLSDELATGQKSDLSQATGGNLAPLLDLDRAIMRKEAFLQNVGRARVDFEAAQGSLSAIRDAIQATREAAYMVQESSQSVAFEQATKTAAVAFETVVAKLNVSVGGRSLFAGAATDQDPLPTGAQVLQQLRDDIALAAPTTVTDFQTFVGDWFSAAGGLADLYQGSVVPRIEAAISEGGTVDALPTAISAEIRQTLGSLASLALAADISISFSQDDGTTIVASEVDVLATSDAMLLDLGANIGRAQNRLETTATELQTELGALSIARSEIVSADPFETAGRLQSTEAQLELLFTLISRQSQLSLTRFL